MATIFKYPPDQPLDVDHCSLDQYKDWHQKIQQFFNQNSYDMEAALSSYLTRYGNIVREKDQRVRNQRAKEYGNASRIAANAERGNKSYNVRY